MLLQFEDTAHRALSETEDRLVWTTSGQSETIRSDISSKVPTNHPFFHVYLKKCFPFFPSLKSILLDIFKESIQIQSHISKNLFNTDLTLCPVSCSILVSTVCVSTRWEQLKSCSVQVRQEVIHSSRLHWNSVSHTLCGSPGCQIES